PYPAVRARHTGRQPRKHPERQEYPRRMPAHTRLRYPALVELRLLRLVQQQTLHAGRRARDREERGVHQVADLDTAAGRYALELDRKGRAVGGEGHYWLFDVEVAVDVRVVRERHRPGRPHGQRVADDRRVVELDHVPVPLHHVAVDLGGSTKTVDEPHRPLAHARRVAYDQLLPFGTRLTERRVRRSWADGAGTRQHLDRLPAFEMEADERLAEVVIGPQRPGVVHDDGAVCLDLHVLYDVSPLVRLRPTDAGGTEEQQRHDELGGPGCSASEP